MHASQETLVGAILHLLPFQKRGTGVQCLWTWSCKRAQPDRGCATCCTTWLTSNKQAHDGPVYKVAARSLSPCCMRGPSETLNKPCKVTSTTQTHLFRNSHHTGDASSHLLQRCDRRTRLFVLKRNEKRFLEQATLPRVLARLESHLEQRKVDEKDKLSSQTKSKADCTPKLSRVNTGCRRS